MKSKIIVIEGLDGSGKATQTKILCEKFSAILSDRYVTSNIIYQMSKLPKEEWNSFIDWLNDFEYEKLGIPKPDLVIYLDVEPEVSQKLMEKRYGGGGREKKTTARKICMRKTSVSFLTVEKVQFMPLKNAAGRLLIAVKTERLRV